MATTRELGVRVAVETGAAQDALGKLSDAMAGLAKATDDAGKEQKTLAKQQADVKAKTDAAREATDRFKRAQAEAAATTQAFGKDSKEAAAAQERLKAAQEAATRATRASEAALKEAADALVEASKSADAKAQPAIRRMADVLQKAGKDADRLASDLRTLDARMAATAKSSDGFFSKFKDGFVMGLGADLARSGLAMLGEGLKSAAGFAVDTAVSYERLKTALETTTGSQAKANEKFAELQKYAAATPFSLEEVTDGYIKLSNRGINANERLLNSLGNTASAMGKTLDDAVEAMADAITGENERWKELGVVGKKSGDQILYTFKGVTTAVKNDAAAITEYFTRLGETNFAGGMEKQSKTLGGLWSTLQDTAGQFADTVMNSGVSDVLREIMVEMTGATAEGKDLAQTLGGSLAEGLKATYNLAKALIPVLEGTARAFNWLFESVNSVNDPLLEAAAKVETVGREFGVAEARLIAYGRAHGDALGPLGEMVKATFFGTEAQENYNAAVREGTRAREDQARAEAAIAALTDRRERETAARLAKLQGEKDSREKAAQMAEFQKLSRDKSLSPSEKKRLNELSKSLDIALPKKRKKSTFGAKSHDFNADVADFEFETTRDVRKSAKAEAAKAEAAAYEAQVGARQKTIDMLGRELEAWDALGEQKGEQVDAIFLTLEVESEAARARESLIDQQLAAEMRLANWQMRNAKTADERTKAQTRLEAAEHARRVENLRRVADAEAKEHAKRQKVVETVTGAVTTLADGMIGAVEAMVAGEKGAMAQMLADLLKGVAKKNAILALEQFALAAGSAASYDFGGAAAHAAAGGMHTGVAIAAGVGAAAAGNIAAGQRGPGGGDSSTNPKSSAEAFGKGAGAGSSTSVGGGSGGRDQGLEAQDVPVSHEQMRRGDSSLGTTTRGGHTVNFSGNIFGAGGRDEFVSMVLKELDRRDRRGARPRI